MNRLVKGGAAGLAATGLMSLVMGAGKLAGLLSTPPPKEITQRAGEGLGGNPERASDEAFGIAWLSAHAAFGIGCGVVFAFMRPLLPGRTVLPGLIYGGTVWGTNYLGILPALRLYPWPEEDSNNRTAVMIAAHAVFGVSLARFCRRRPQT